MDTLKTDHKINYHKTQIATQYLQNEKIIQLFRYLQIINYIIKFTTKGKIILVATLVQSAFVDHELQN